MTSKEIKLKHCMVGEAGVGKTSIVVRYVEDIFDPKYELTMGVNFLTKTIEMDKKNIILNIWDTAGSERFRSMVSIYYHGITSCMIVYDITNRESFEDVEGWFTEVKLETKDDHVLICIVGTKSDLGSLRVVRKEEGEQLAMKLGCMFFEVTSIEGNSVEMMFQKMLEEIDFDKLPKTDTNQIIQVDEPVKKKCC